MIEVVNAFRSGLLMPRNWPRNIVAGVIVGIVALPLAMAFAIASGVRPEQGLVTAIIAGVIVALLGGSPVQISGPTGAFVVILAGVVARYGVLGLQVATILAGIMLFVMGLVRLGNVIKFIPDPVITGFTSGIGVIIFISALKDFLGLTIMVPLDAHFYQKLYGLVVAAPLVHPATVGLGCLSLMVLWGVPKVSKQLPGPLVALVVAAVIQRFYPVEGVATIGSAFGAMSAGWPDFKIPMVSWPQIFELIGPAFTIALLGAIESLLSAAAADAVAGTRHRSNQELMGQGIANIVAPFWGGFASTGAIARTVTNVRNGGNSPISGVVHALVLLAILLWLAPWAAYIPLYVLSAILMVVAMRMSDWAHFVGTLRRAPRYDVWVLLATFSLTIFTDLVVAVNVGVILAMLFFVRRMAQSVTVEEQPLAALWAAHAEAGMAPPPEGLRIYAIQGPFFFGVAEKIEKALWAASEVPTLVIFRLKDVPFMDLTGLAAFRVMIQKFEGRGTKVYLCGARPHVQHKLQEAGVLAHVAGHKVFDALPEVLCAIRGVSCVNITA